MSEQSASEPLVDVHVADWTVVHVRRDLDLDTVSALATHLTPLLEPGSRIAVDLRRSAVEPATAVAVLHLAEAATASGARLVVVEPRAEAREVLRAAGVAHVHESLDAAVHDLAPVAREPRREAPPLAPASSDAMLVAAEDVLGQGPQPS